MYLTIVRSHLMYALTTRALKVFRRFLGLWIATSLALGGNFDGRRWQHLWQRWWHSLATFSLSSDIWLAECAPGHSSAHMLFVVFYHNSNTMEKLKSTIPFNNRDYISKKNQHIKTKRPMFYVINLQRCPFWIANSTSPTGLPKSHCTRFSC